MTLFNRRLSIAIGRDAIEKSNPRRTSTVPALKLT